MASYAKSLNRLIEEFSKLPGIGPRSAERMAMYVLKGSLDEAKFSGATDYLIKPVEAEELLKYIKKYIILSTQ